jgi:hypothetical protein
MDDTEQPPSGAHNSGYWEWHPRGTRATQCLGVLLGHPLSGGYKYGEIECWRGPAANLLNYTKAAQVTKTNDRPDLSSEGAPDIEKRISNSQIVINVWSWAPDGARHQDRLTDWPSVVIRSLTDTLWRWGLTLDKRRKLGYFGDKRSMYRWRTYISGFSHKMLYVLLTTSCVLATCSDHLILFDSINPNNICWWVQIAKSSSYIFFQGSFHFQFHRFKLSSVPGSIELLVAFIPLGCKTTFHTHISRHERLDFSSLYVLILWRAHCGSTVNSASVCLQPLLGNRHDSTIGSVFFGVCSGNDVMQQ